MSQTYKLKITAKEVDERLDAVPNKLDKEKLPDEINKALKIAKESGEFDGAPGKSGVYVGSGEMPEDCNVQIDPNGDTFQDQFLLYSKQNLTQEEQSQARENIGIDLSDYVKKEDIELSKQYELIDTIEIAEDGLSGITLNKTADDIDYNFEKVFIKNYIPKGTKAVSVNFFFGSLVISQSVISTSNTYSTTKAWIENGVLMGEGTGSATAEYNPLTKVAPAYGRSMKFGNNINSIKIAIAATDTYFPIGTKFDIYGVWKD